MNAYRVIFSSDWTNCYFPYVCESCESFAHATGLYFGFRNYVDTGKLVRLVLELEDRTVICDTYRDRSR